jgi:nicotinate-nucleotide adenylyltransferase
MKKVVVFGGSFNPPTNAHFALAAHISERKDVEKVIFVPVSDLYQKISLIESLHRVNMLRMVVDTNHKFDLSLIEQDSKYLLNTYETMSLLKEEYPDNELCFLMGADNLLNLLTWEQGEDLLVNFSLFVIGRNGLVIESLINANTLLVDNKHNIIYDNSFPELNISSTYVREKSYNGQNIRYLVPSEIDDYIHENHLYQEKPLLLK